MTSTSGSNNNILTTYAILTCSGKNEEYNDQDFINEICTAWSGALPFTGIFDENLILLSHWEGKRDEAYFLKVIDSLLARKKEQL